MVISLNLVLAGLRLGLKNHQVGEKWIADDCYYKDLLSFKLVVLPIICRYLETAKIKLLRGMIVSIYAKVSIMQFETPTSSLKAITNNLTRAANIYKSLVIIQR
jgi:hypothetical protein